MQMCVSGLHRTRKHSHLQCTPTFRSLLLALQLSLLELQLSCQFFFVSTFLGHTFLVHRTVLTQISRFVALVTDSGFLYPSCLCPCLSDRRTCFNLSSGPWGHSCKLRRHPWENGAQLSHEEDRPLRFSFAQKNSVLPNPSSPRFCTSGVGAKYFSNTPRFTVSAMSIRLQRPELLSTEVRLCYRCPAGLSLQCRLLKHRNPITSGISPRRLAPSRSISTRCPSVKRH